MRWLGQGARLAPTANTDIARAGGRIAVAVLPAIAESGVVTAPLWTAGGFGIIALLFSFVFSGNAVLFLRRSVSLARAFAALLQKGTVWVSAYNDFGVSWPFGATRLGDGSEGGPDVFGSIPSTSQ